MALFTKSEFKRIAGTRKGDYKSFGQVMNEAKLSSRSLAKPSVFISHAHTDKEIIAQAVAFLKGINVEIYVDWMDETMPQKPDGTTASKFKAKILENKKFLFLATDQLSIQNGVIGKLELEMHTSFCRTNFVFYHWQKITEHGLAMNISRFIRELNRIQTTTPFID